ncbi:hypothetical protein MTP99_016601 [Tenebrio molitor]|nr:hypothetical protein MTP99_016601 [Tenebrio molitor]
MKVCVLVIMMGVFADAGFYEDRLYKDAVQFVKECGARSLTMCLKEKALKFVERLPNDIDIGNGIRIKQSDSGRLPREHTPITLPDEAAAREAILDRVLLERLADYFSSHTLEFKIPIGGGETAQEEGRKKEGGGGYGGGGGGKGGKKGGKKGGMMPLMMMFQMKAAMMGAIALKFVGLIAFKALLVAKVALTIAIVVTLKKLVENKHSTQTYEVVAHPHEDYSHYDRVYNPEVVYKGYRVGS